MAQVCPSPVAATRQWAGTGGRIHRTNLLGACWLRRRAVGRRRGRHRACRGRASRRGIVESAAYIARSGKSARVGPAVLVLPALAVALPHDTATARASYTPVPAKPSKSARARPRTHQTLSLTVRVAALCLLPKTPPPCLCARVFRIFASHATTTYPCRPMSWKGLTKSVTRVGAC